MSRTDQVSSHGRKSNKAGSSVPGKTKCYRVIQLLNRSKGATIADLQKATGWQAHSVRGFLSGTLRKRMGLTINSERSNRGVRRYRLIGG